MGNLVCGSDTRTINETPRYDTDHATKSAFKEAGQEHVFDAWQTLDEVQRSELLADCETFDPVEVNTLFEDLVQGVDKNQSELQVIKPYESDICQKEHLSQDDLLKYQEAGNQLIKGGRAAVLILAGGQGTRLGFHHPKGMFCLNHLPSRKSIFQLLTERFIRVQKLVSEGKLPCKMLVMTSRENHQETVSFFRDNAYFGANEENFMFFPQAMLPALSLEGKILMNSPSTIKLAPNGNGALFDSIKTRGDLREFIATLDYLQVIGVDNAINKILDPVQIGYTQVNQLEASLKCCPKRSPEEKVGVVATRDGKYAIVEYSDLSTEHMNAVKEDGSLLFGQGSILIFMISAPLLLKLTDPKLPPTEGLYHKAFKKVEHCDLQKMEQIRPDKENAWKFELFLQSFLSWVTDSRLGILEVRRETEFAPLKNAEGTDSPLSSAELLLKEASEWLAKAGVTLSDAAVNQIEISPLLSYSGENLESLAGQTFDVPGYIDETGTFKPAIA